MDIDLRRRDLLTAGSSLLIAGGLAGREAQAADAAAETPPPLEFVMKVTADIADPMPLGVAAAGDRRIIPITGGSFEGPKLRGLILPGGEDAQFDRSDGVTVFEARYWLKASDGAVIKVVNRALRSRDRKYLRTQPEFEAPVGPHDWLNGAIFVGTLAPGAGKQVVLRYYRVA